MLKFLSLIFWATTVAAENIVLPGTICVTTSNADAVTFIIQCNDRFSCTDSQILKTSQWTKKGEELVFSDLAPGWYRVAVIGTAQFKPWASFVFQLETTRTATLNIELEIAKEHFPIQYKVATKKDLEEYSKYLDSLNKAEFCSKASIGKATESYRFLWLRTFARPILISVILTNDENILINYKEADGTVGYDLGKLDINQFIDLNKRFQKEYPEEPEYTKETLDLVKDFADELFWNLDYYIDEMIFSLDGSSWVIEGIRDGKCHVVTRSDPSRGEPLRQFAEFLIKISGKRFYYDEVH